MLSNIFQIFIISTWIKFSHSVFPVYPKVIDNSNTCEPSKSSKLVENFFNLIFTEFHTTPPICTCVQMCPDQPAYCYPNGCMKKNMKESETKSSHGQVRRSAPPQIHKLTDTHPVRVFIEDKDDFLSFFEKTHRTNSDTEKPVMPVYNNLRPSIFKDRYNMLIKYKRMPKVELKYNLREQVRTMKSARLKIESIDVSKTRWPHPKQSVQINQKNVEPESETFDSNMALENNPTLLNKGFSKRENTDEKDNNNNNNKPILEDAPNPLNTSIGGQVESHTSVKNIAQVPTVTNAIESESNETASNNGTSKNKIYVVLRLGESNVVPSDEKTRNLKNFDIDSSINLKEPYNNTYNNMIASLFKSIGKEDTASMEIEEQYFDIHNVNLMKTEQFRNEYETSEINIKSNSTREINSSIKEPTTNATANTKF